MEQESGHYKRRTDTHIHTHINTWSLSSFIFSKYVFISWKVGDVDMLPENANEQ